MAILVRHVIDDASKILADEGTRRNWPQADLLRWLNLAEKAICMVKPDAFQAVRPVVLSVGTLQSIPNDCTMLGRVTRNMGGNGTTPGKTVSEIPIDIMDLHEDWHTDTAASVIKHFIRIPDNPRSYYVYPPAASGVYVEISCPAIPADLSETNFTTGTVAINLPDIYHNPILELILFRAFDTLSSNIAGMQEKSNAALSRGIQMLTGRSDAEAETKARSVMAQPGRP